MNKKLIIIVLVVAVLVVFSALVISGAYFLKDITITNVTAPSSAIHGQKLNVTSIVKNRGIASTGSFDVNFYLTTQKNINNRTFIGKRTISNLGGRAINQQTSPVIIPDNVTPGNYYILAYADFNNTIKELDEDNNGRFTANTITIT